MNNTTSNNFTNSTKNKKTTVDWETWCFGDVGLEEFHDLTEHLGKDEEVTFQIQEFLNSLYKKDVDMIAVQSQIIDLIHKCVDKFSDDKEKAEDIKLSKKNPEDLKKRISELSLFLMQREASKYGHTEHDLDVSIGDLHHVSLSIKAKQELQKAVKRFVVYEIYKVMSPIQIAGETMRQNFVNNATLRGVDKAVEYEGGMEQALQKYGSHTIKELDKSISKRPKIKHSGSLER